MMEKRREQALRILVVEDEKPMRELLQKRLSEEGYSVDGAEDGVEALDFLAAAEYDGVVLDIMLPRRCRFMPVPFFPEPFVSPGNAA